MSLHELTLEILNDLDFEIKGIFIDAKNSTKDVIKANIHLFSNGMVVDGVITFDKLKAEFTFEKRSLSFEDGRKMFIFMADGNQIPYEEVPFSKEAKVLCEKLFINSYIEPKWFEEACDIVSNYANKSTPWDSDF